jgi:hypothetical protein
MCDDVNVGHGCRELQLNRGAGDGWRFQGAMKRERWGEGSRNPTNISELETPKDLREKNGHRSKTVWVRDERKWTRIGQRARGIS